MGIAAKEQACYNEPVKVKRGEQPRVAGALWGFRTRTNEAVIYARPEDIKPGTRRISELPVLYRGAEEWADEGQAA